MEQRKEPGKMHKSDRDFPMKPDNDTGAWPNEGEGSRSAAREYNRGVQAFERTGQVESKAREAAKALDGPEAAELRRAEEEGKRHAKGEDPELRAKKP